MNSNINLFKVEMISNLNENLRLNFYTDSQDVKGVMELLDIPADSDITAVITFNDQNDDIIAVFLSESKEPYNTLSIWHPLPYYTIDESDPVKSVHNYLY